MSESHQSPRNGLAKLLWEADTEDDPRDVAERQSHFGCPECGWKSQLRRNECMVCEYGQPLQPVPGAEQDV